MIKSNYAGINTDLVPNLNKRENWNFELGKE